MSFLRSDVGTSGALETMFYCEVMNEDKVSNGGGVDGNFIWMFSMRINYKDASNFR